MAEEAQGQQVDGATPETQQTDQQSQQTASVGQDETQDDGKGGKAAILAELAAERKKRQEIEKQYEKQRQASMTEAERAVAEAEARGAQTATQKLGQRLARSEFDAAAGRRNPEFDTKQVFEFLDLARFVGEDGEPDSKAIAAAVEQLVPAPNGTVPSFDGGKRISASGGDFNSVIRRAAGRG